MLKISEVCARSILSTTGLPADYVINPYVGCQHACVYCYACFMKKFSAHTEPWGTFVDIKINAPEVLPVKPAKYENKSIYFSSVTDAYQPLERKYELTRKILEKLVQFQPKISIQTKSSLVLRDRDILRQFSSCEVGFTIMTMDEKLRREIEPFASPIAERITALKQIHDEGIPTYIFIGPILPYLTGWKEIISATKGFVNYYMIDSFNTRGAIWSNVRRWLATSHPDLLSRYDKIYVSGEDYWRKVSGAVHEFSKSEGIDSRIFF
ncbi:MAG: radical SAM protein [Candidatus Marinimicrobia bacterium]|nr:radical SAM protein [Candidatus Neomarinimicrobiota bacterium]